MTASQAYNPSYWKQRQITETSDAPRCLGCGWLYRRPEVYGQITRMFCRACESKREA